MERNGVKIGTVRKRELMRTRKSKGSRDSAPRFVRYHPNKEKSEHEWERREGWTDRDNRVGKGPVEGGDQGGKKT